MITEIIPGGQEEHEWNPCYKEVKCSKCGREYKCLPNDDYYNSTNANDGVCEVCLMESTFGKKKNN